MYIARFLKSDRCGPWIVGVLCVLLVVPMMPRTASAVPFPVEYETLVNLVAVIVAVLSSAIEQPSGQVVGDQLTAAVLAAKSANENGQRAPEISRLGKAIGAAEALMGITASCDTCGDARTDLQQVIGLASFLKSQELGIAGACLPDGIIQGNEQCDPLATPNGCPTDTTANLFCNDECQCQVTVTP